MELEPYEGLQPPDYELPIKIRDFAAEAAAAAAAKKAQEPIPVEEHEEFIPHDPNDNATDKFLRLLPDDLRERLQLIKAKYLQEEEEEPSADDEVEEPEPSVFEEQHHDGGHEEGGFMEFSLDYFTVEEHYHWEPATVDELGLMAEETLFHLANIYEYEHAHIQKLDEIDDY